MRKQLWPAAAEELLQSSIDGIVQAVLERSELIEPSKPLRKQRGDKDQEHWVDGLFRIAAAKAENR